MITVATCPHCGAPLEGAAGGLCPRCLMELGVRLNTAALRALAAKPRPGGHLEFQRNEAVAPRGAAESVVRLPRLFGDYELLEEIARGGMGAVYKARQRSLNRCVAVKMVLGGPFASAAATERFLAEAQAAASLQHPNIVAIHQVGEQEGQPFFSMDLVEGKSLGEMLREGPFEPRRAARYLKTIAEAVHYAHQKGILHRDLKPSNVLVDATDEPRITDFGLAKRLTDDGDLTVSGQVLGSPNFMAPEQAQGLQCDVGPRSDIYSLGALLYHLLTGRPPFQAATLTEVLRQVVASDPAPPRMLNPSLPRDLETICLKCLEKEVSRRYPTARELAHELQRFLDGKPILARPLALPAKAAKWCRRKPQVAAFAAVAFLAMVFGFGGILSQWRRAEANASATRQHAYVLAMNAAQGAIQAGNPGRALELLNQHRTASPAFEWRYLWQQCQTEAECVVGRMSSGVRSLEISPDGRWLVAGTELGAVRLWNLVTREQIEMASDGGVKGFAAFSPDSRLLAFTEQTLNSFGSIKIWDTQTRKYEPPVLDEWPVGPSRFAPDGSWFAYGAVGPLFEIKSVLLEFPSRRPIATIPHLTKITDSVHGVDGCCTDGKKIIFSENDPVRRIALCNLRQAGEPQYSPQLTEAVTAMALSPNNILASAEGFTETGIKLWEVPSFRLLGTLEGHQAWVASLRFSPDGKTLVSGSIDRTIRFWDVATRKLARTFDRLPHEVWRVCYSPEGRSLYSGSADGTIHLWPVAGKPEGQEFRIVPTGLDNVTLAPNGMQFAGLRGGAVCLGKTDSGTAPVRLEILGTNNVSLLFSADGQWLFAGTQNGQVQRWAWSQNRLFEPLHGSDAPARTLNQSTTGNTLVVGQWKTELQPGRVCRMGIWDAGTWKQRKPVEFSAVGPASAVTPSGDWLAVAHWEGPVRVWCLTHEQGPRTLDFYGLGVTFSPDGRLLVSFSREGRVKVWEVPTFRELHEIRAHSSRVWAAAFSSDGSRLLTGGTGDQALKIWDVVTSQELVTLQRARRESILSIVASSDDGQVTAANSKGDLLLWRVPSLAEINAREAALSSFALLPPKPRP